MSNEDLNDDNNENKDLPVRVHPGTPRRGGLRESLSKLSGSSSTVMLEELKSILATHKYHSPGAQSHRNDEEDKPPVRTRASTADESKENKREQGIQKFIFPASELLNKCVSFEESVPVEVVAPEKDNPRLAPNINSSNICCFPQSSQCQQNCLHKQIQGVLEMEEYIVEERFTGLSPIMQRKLREQQQSEIVREASMEYQHAQEQQIIPRKTEDYLSSQSEVYHENQDTLEITLEGKLEIPIKRNKNLRSSIGRGNSLDEDILKEISPTSVHRNYQNLQDEAKMRRDKGIQLSGINESQKCNDVAVKSSKNCNLANGNQETQIQDLDGERNSQDFILKNYQIRSDEIINSTGNQMNYYGQKAQDLKDNNNNNIQSEDIHGEYEDICGDRIGKLYHLNVCPVKEQERQEGNGECNEEIKYEQVLQVQDIRKKTYINKISQQANAYGEEEEIKSQIINNNFSSLSSNKEINPSEEDNQGFLEKYEWLQQSAISREQLVSRKYGKDSRFSQFKPYQKQNSSEYTAIPIIECQEEDDSEDDQETKRQHQKKMFNKDSQNYLSDDYEWEDKDHQQEDKFICLQKGYHTSVFQNTGEMKKLQETNDGRCEKHKDMITSEEYQKQHLNNFVGDYANNCGSQSLGCESQSQQPSSDPRPLNAVQQPKEHLHLSEVDLTQVKTSKEFSDDYFSHLSPIPPYEPFNQQTRTLLDLDRKTVAINIRDKTNDIMQISSDLFDQFSTPFLGKSSIEKDHSAFSTIEKTRDSSQATGNIVEEKNDTGTNNYCGQNQNMLEKPAENREDYVSHYYDLNIDAKNEEQQVSKINVSKGYSQPFQQLNFHSNSPFSTCSSLQIPSLVETQLVQEIQDPQISISKAQTSESYQILQNNNFDTNTTQISPKPQQQFPKTPQLCFEIVAPHFSQFDSVSFASQYYTNEH